MQMNFSRKHTSAADYSRHRAGRGFTLIEVMVSLAIMTILMMLILPSYSHFESGRMANNCAQELAATLRRAESSAIHNECYYELLITDSQHYSVYNNLLQSVFSSTTGALPLNSTPIASANLLTSYGRVQMQVNASFPATLGIAPNGWTIGPHGWPAKSGDPATTTLTEQQMNVTMNGQSQTVYYYDIVCNAGGTSTGNGLSYTVRVFENGHIQIL